MKLKKRDVVFITGIMIFIVFAHIVIKYAYEDFKARETIIVSESASIDLADWDEKISTFKGAVNFYFGMTLAEYREDIIPTVTSNLPLTWSSSKDYSNYSAYGYGLYEWTFTGLDPKKNYGLKIEDVETAYTLYNNGIRLVSVGEVSTDANTHQGNSMGAFVGFTTNSKGEAHMFMEVSNYSLHVGGIWNTIKLGLYDDILLHSQQRFLFQMILSAGTFTMMLLALGFIVKDPNRKALPVVALLSFVATINSIFSGNRLGYYLFPTIPFSFELRIEYLSGYLLIPIFVMLCSVFINTKYSKQINYAIGIISSILTFVCLFMPQHIYIQLWKPYLIIGLALTLTLLILLISNFGRAYSGKRIITFSIALSIIALDKELNFSTDYTLVAIVSFIVIYLFGWLTIREYTDDIKENKRLQKKVNIDELTGLFNREYFLERLEKLKMEEDEIEAESRHHYIMFMDLDGLKPVNDSVSHTAGDYVIIESSQRIKRSLRATDLSARFGGDEFLVLLRNVERNNVEEVANRIIDYINESIETPEGNFNMGVSIGIYKIDINEDVRTWISNSDKAMYYSKQNGRNCYTFYESMKSHSTEYNNFA